MKFIILFILFLISACSKGYDCDRRKNSSSLIKIGKSHPIYLDNYKEICKNS